jgi:hypothetical protein
MQASAKVTNLREPIFMINDAEEAWPRPPLYYPFRETRVGQRLP